MFHQVSENTSHYRKLHFATLNVCGLKTRSQYPDFIDYCNKFDLLCFTETKIDETDVIPISGFITFSQSRRQNFERKSGGNRVSQRK